MNSRLVNTYMDEYMGDFLFDAFQPFHFYHDATVDYFIPQNESQDGAITKDTYTDYIELLPLANSPGVFGLHQNAEIGYYTKATKEVQNHINWLLTTEVSHFLATCALLGNLYYSGELFFTYVGQAFHEFVSAFIFWNLFNLSFSYGYKWWNFSRRLILEQVERQEKR